MSDLNAQDILTSDGKYPDRAKLASAGVVANAADLAKKVSPLLAAYGKRPAISSGFRDPASNKAAGGAPHSAHLEGKAVDFVDADRKLSSWCLANLPLLVKYGLWMEEPSATPNWLHLQARPIPGTSRVFKP